MDYVGLIIERNDGKILFQLRDNKKNIPNPNLWSIFGGGIKEKENLKNAAIRELKEELGVKIRKEDLKLISKSPSSRKKNYIYRLKWNKKLSDLQLKEGSNMKYFTRKEILRKKNVVPSLKLFLRVYPLIKIFR